VGLELRPQEVGIGRAAAKSRAQGRGKWADRVRSMTAGQLIPAASGYREPAHRSDRLEKSGLPGAVFTDEKGDRRHEPKIQLTDKRQGERIAIRLLDPLRDNADAGQEHVGRSAGGTDGQEHQRDELNWDPTSAETRVVIGYRAKPIFLEIRTARTLPDVAAWCILTRRIAEASAIAAVTSLC
jgi:hypothetical protein